MRTRRQKMLEDRQTVAKRLNAGGNSLSIPVDLIFEILLRLPVKSIARSRCVSKLWDSILDREDFTDEYLVRSSANPKLLFAYKKDSKLFFFSLPQNQDDNSSLRTASYLMSFPVNSVKQIYRPISGLVCIKDERILKGKKTRFTVLMICNPSTGQSFTLPRIKTKKKNCGVKSYFGYDPVEKQFKVLSMTTSRMVIGRLTRVMSDDHQVLTLRSGKLSWRMIECGVHHHPVCKSVCINGVLYYKANSSIDGEMMIVSFDVRSEKFSFIKVMQPFMDAVVSPAILINFNGKLASVQPYGTLYSFDSRTTSLNMWVLDDLEKKEWSNHMYKLPQLWESVVADSSLCRFEVTASNEVVLSDYLRRPPFYVFYYNLERETIRRVEIQGMEVEIQGMERVSVHTFVDHVEDVKRMKGVLGLRNGASKAGS